MEKCAVVAVPAVRRRRRNLHRIKRNRSLPTLLSRTDDRADPVASPCVTSPAMRTSQFMFATAPLYLSVVASSSCFNPCAALAAALPGAVAFPNSTAYVESNTYWSNRQSEVQPACFITPQTTADVSTAVKIITSHNIPFSVKSGGHTAFAGASNVQGGITIDLRNLNKITVSEDRETVSVGPGNRWIEISSVLDPLGLAVVGGRAADVGVSGLILGGGISYFSGKRGWACDNVRSFEVVLASGKVVKASPTENNDLFWALRGGGGSSFGIVTGFDLVSFSQGDLWSGDSIFPGAMAPDLVPHFVDLAINGLPSDPEAHTYFVYTNQPALGGTVALTSFYHSTPPPAPETVPPVFETLRSQPNAIFSSSAIANVSTLSRNIDQPYGQRQTWWDTTVRIESADIFVEILALFEAHMSRILAAAGDTALTPFLVFQPISTNIIEGMQQNGGNALNLKPEEGPVMIIQTTASWDDGSIDSIVEESCRQFIGEVEAAAKEKGVSKSLVYMNYAGSQQKVFESYGEESFNKLRATARKYDPKGKLQSLWKGYFKV
ncbi:hypothetical protein jhhlp_006091 [Lomentospora prolificans]|uniref:FAD-binding PCMH-type domain-containing protein n=1 Tax=Lomentospora prolificans TaxID=41688 RepID=A0A2N3N4Y3_9PEZI|nr:hypothetical protein jhhlp_006091 [Lomentospora prolificans]